LKQAKYAVAVRDGSKLFLFRKIKRQATTDIYVSWPLKRFLFFDNPHATYHASGQLHLKTSPKCKVLPPEYRQKPDASLKGVEGIVMTPIHAKELKKTCIPSRYDNVFEIPISDISAGLYVGDYQMQFALAEAGVPVPVTDMPGSPQLIRQYAFRDDVPWIVVTLFKP
jgi:hypothetical protein